MLRKLGLVLFCAVFCVTIIPALSHAKDFVVGSYDFTWNVASSGNLIFEIKRDQDRVGTVLRNRVGTRMNTLFMSGSEARAIGQVLVKAEEYAQQVEKSQPRTPKTVIAGDYRITFTRVSSSRFEVDVQRDKLFSPRVLFDKRQAVEIGKYMTDAEEMIAFLKRRMKI